MNVSKTEQIAVFHGVVDAALVADVSEGELLPGVAEHRDQLLGRVRQALDLLQLLFTLHKIRTIIITSSVIDCWNNNNNNNIAIYR